MDHNALDQSDCRISKPNLSREQNDEIPGFFACGHKLW